MKKFMAIVLLIIILFSGCSFGESSATESFFAMDTYMSVKINGNGAEKIVKEVKSEIKKLDKKLSAHSKTGEIYNLNKTGSAKLSFDSSELINQALKYYKLTGGAFNPAMLSVSKLWGFPDKKYRVPSRKEIINALKNTNPDKITVNGNEVKLNGVKIDLGAIAKGYTSQKITDILKKKGVKSALLNLGGNVQTFGPKPDDDLWIVAVENPDKDSGYLGLLTVKDKAVVTSGGYERNFKKNGKTYHHILNPENGYPAESVLASVTIVSENGTLADAYSTALFVMGEKKAEKFWAKSGGGFDIILYTKSGGLKISEGIADVFNSDLNYEVIKRSDYE